jgi:hypothetical protein
MILTINNNYSPNSINQPVFVIKLHGDFCDLRTIPPPTIPPHHHHHLQGLCKLDPSVLKHEAFAFLNII